MAFFKSQNFLIFVGFAMLAGIAGLNLLFLIPDEIVLPKALLANAEFASFKTSDTNFESLRGKQLPYGLISDIKRLLIDYREVDPRNGTKSVLKSTILWTVKFIGMNYLYIIPIVFMASYLGVAWGFVSVVVALGLFGATALLKDMPTLLFQMKALYVYFSNDTEIGIEVAMRIPNYFESIEALLKYEAGVKIFIFVISGIASGLLSDRRSMNFLQSLEEARGEMLKLQAQLGQGKNTFQWRH